MVNKAINVILIILVICLLAVLSADIASLISFFGPRWMEISTAVYG